MTLANAHPLFYCSKPDPSYLAALTIDPNERTRLIKIRDEIRGLLRRAAATVLANDNYWVEDFRSANARRTRASIQPKFMTQGSFAYKTVNKPAQSTQEIDLDDGMYVPVDFLATGHPALMAKGLFEFVETVLEGARWNLDKTKDTCVRVLLSGGAHIDIPIYSIPIDQYQRLSESHELAMNTQQATRSFTDSFRLPSDKVMLAKRDGTWVRSDPQPLHKWVLGRQERYGPVYTRLCRYFKGWRDKTWEKSSLSSLAIMVAVDRALSKINGLPANCRDDELILEVAKRLPEIFSGEIQNPVIPGLESVLNKWSVTEKHEIVKETQKLCDGMETALLRTGDADRVVIELKSQFGERIPHRPDMITINSPIHAIERTPAATVAAPLVIPSISG